MLRIGTQNMAHERNASPMVLKRQLDLMRAADCDLWLLTEVPYTFRTVSAPGSTALSESMDRTHKVYAAVWGRDGVEPQREIHEAAALARAGGLRVCSCMLPSGEMPIRDWPDPGFDRASVLRTTIDRLRRGLEGGADGVVLGGNWSQELAGEDGAGTADGRGLVEELLAALDLQVPTAALPRLSDGEAGADGARSIDHIAVPRAWKVTGASRHVAEIPGHPRCRDHDVYLVEVEP